MKKRDDSFIQLRATNMLILLYFIVIAFVLAFITISNILLAEKTNTGKSIILEMAIIMILFFIILIFLLRGGIKIYKTRYMGIKDNFIIIKKMVGQFQVGTECLKGKMKYQCDTFHIEDIHKIGYSNELYGHSLEFHQGKTSYQIKNNEMVFELVDGERITIDISWFSKKKMKDFFYYINKKTKIFPEKNLRKDFGIKKDL